MFFRQFYPPWPRLKLNPRNGTRQNFSGHGFSHGSVTVLVTIKHLPVSSSVTVKNG
jgi:hypothetical protein